MPRSSAKRRRTSTRNSAALAKGDHSRTLVTPAQVRAARLSMLADHPIHVVDLAVAVRLFVPRACEGWAAPQEQPTSALEKQSARMKSG